MCERFRYLFSICYKHTILLVNWSCTNNNNNNNNNNNSPTPTTTISIGSGSNVTKLGDSNHSKTSTKDPIPIIPTRPTFSGTTYPGATVTVTVYSDPVSCTTNANAQGKWSCTLAKDLPEGTHTVYVTIKHGNQTDKLGPYKVRVVAGLPTTLNSDDLASTGISVRLITTLAIALISLATIATATLVATRKHRATYRRG